MAYEWIVEGLAQTWGNLDAALRPQPPAAYDAPTACPGWSVRDVLSHLLGFESMLRGAPVPAHEGPWPDYVVNPIGEFNEAFVQANRARPGVEVLDDFRAAAGESLAALRSLDEAGWDKVGWSPEGDRPYHRFQETRLLDSWIHLEDVRDALALATPEGETGEEVTLNRFESALPYVVGKKAGAPDATSVRLNLTGSLARSVAVVVRDRRAEAVDALDQVPTLELTTPTSAFWRRCAGRIDVDRFLDASQVVGDAALARAVADALRIMI